jgi:hypothetical protein
MMTPPRRRTNDVHTSKKRSAAPKRRKKTTDRQRQSHHSSAAGSGGASHTSASPRTSLRTKRPILSAGAVTVAPAATNGVAANGEPGEMTDRLILRTQVARILGVHVSTVRRLEKTGALKPVVIDPSGAHLHSLRAVQEYAAQMKTPAMPVPEDNIDGELTAQAFTLLDGDAGAADLVTTLKIPSAVARKLEQEWAELRGHIIIDGATLNRIRARRSSSEYPLFSGEDILKYMDSIEFDRCLGCRRPATFCTLCFHHQPDRAVEAARLEIHHAEVRQAEAYRAQFAQQMAAQARERQAYANRPPAPPPAPYRSQPRRPGPVSPAHDPRSPNSTSAIPAPAPAAPYGATRAAAATGAPVGGVSSDDTRNIARVPGQPTEQAVGSANRGDANVLNPVGDLTTRSGPPENAGAAPQGAGGGDSAHRRDADMQRDRGEAPPSIEKTSRGSSGADALSGSLPFSPGGRSPGRLFDLTPTPASAVAPAADPTELEVQRNKGQKS